MGRCPHLVRAHTSLSWCWIWLIGWLLLGFPICCWFAPLFFVILFMSLLLVLSDSSSLSVSTYFLLYLRTDTQEADLKYSAKCWAETQTYTRLKVEIQFSNIVYIFISISGNVLIQLPDIKSVDTHYNHCHYILISTY